MIVQVNARHPRPAVIAAVVRMLKRGGLIVYPTETAYGLGADVRNRKAVARIFALKRRALGKALSVIVSDMGMAKQWVMFSLQAARLVRRHWPGPLTIVTRARPRALRVSGLTKDTLLALRVSSHPVARALARGLGAPIIATSANVSGQGECYSRAAVLRQFGRLPRDVWVLDAGRLPRRPPSTVVRVGRTLEVLRQGSIRV